MRAAVAYAMMMAAMMERRAASFPLPGFNHAIRMFPSHQSASNALDLLGKNRMRPFRPCSLLGCRSMAAAAQVKFGPLRTKEKSKVLVLIGNLNDFKVGGLRKHIPPSLDQTVVTEMLKELSEGGAGSSSSTWVREDQNAMRVVMGLLADKVSRHNSPTQVHTLASLLQSNIGQSGNARVIVAIGEDGGCGPVASALARALPCFSMKSKRNEGDASSEEDRRIFVNFVKPDGSEVEDSNRLQACDIVHKAVSLSMSLVDEPPETMVSFAAPLS
eukprot:764046-Hanusia_phi.AAC.5